MDGFKLVKDLEVGDLVQLDDGVGTVTSVCRFPIVDTAPQLGGTYEVEWKVGEETGRALVGALAQVRLAQSGNRK